MLRTHRLLTVTIMGIALAAVGLFPPASALALVNTTSAGQADQAQRTPGRMMGVVIDGNVEVREGSLTASRESPSRLFRLHVDAMTRPGATRGFGNLRSMGGPDTRSSFFDVFFDVTEVKIHRPSSGKLEVGLRGKVTRSPNAGLVGTEVTVDSFFDVFTEIRPGPIVDRHVETTVALGGPSFGGTTRGIIIIGGMPSPGRAR